MQALTTKATWTFNWDHAGVIGSLMCITHCVATPFLAAVLPVLAVTEKETHIGLTVVLMIFGLLAFLPGYRRHSKPHMAVVAIVGFAMLVLAVLTPEAFASETLETGLTVVGGLLLTTAHLSNAYYCRRCCVCAEQPCKQSQLLVLRIPVPASDRPVDGDDRAGLTGIW